jgi:hydrogenase nickel incorporation protein HypA/HybF
MMYIMHERSLVKAVIDQACQEQKQRGLGRLTGIELEIGEFAGIDVCLFKLAFFELSVEYWGRPVNLNVTEAPLTAKCTNCGQEFPIHNFRFLCPMCQSGHVEVTRGEDIKLCQLVTERIEEIEGVFQ